MKLRFYRCWYNEKEKSSTLAAAIALEPIDEKWEQKWQAEWKKNVPDRVLTSAMARENALARPYSTYLASSLVSDFPAYSPHHAENVLNEIKRLERGEIAAHTWEGDGFVHMMTPTTVTFEHSIFGECPEWPLWSCTLAQYKAALQGWRKFIDMPQSIETELIVELPESNP